VNWKRKETETWSVYQMQSGVAKLDHFKSADLFSYSCGEIFEDLIPNLINN